MYAGGMGMESSSSLSLALKSCCWAMNTLPMKQSAAATMPARAK